MKQPGPTINLKIYERQPGEAGPYEANLYSTNRSAHMNAHANVKT